MLESQSADPAEVRIYNDSLLTQKERDIETDLDYFQARYYSSAQGRFTSVDPENYQARQDFSDPQSWNAYSYVNNNPLRRVDPDGKGFGDFWEKFRNWWKWGMFDSDAEVQRYENQQRAYLVSRITASNGLIYVDVPVFEELHIIVAVNPLTLSREDVFTFYSLTNGAKDVPMTREELASAVTLERPSPALKDNPWHDDVVKKRVRPEYKANPAHDPKSPSFNPKKTPEPDDAASVYENSVRAGFGTWYGRAANGKIYRFFSNNYDSVHFSGIVTKSQVPKVILKQLGF